MASASERIPPWSGALGFGGGADAAFAGSLSPENMPSEFAVADARDMIEPGILCATVGKNRDDDTVGMTVRLRIDRTGRITDE